MNEESPRVNPYAASVTEVASQPAEVDFAPVIREWEKLRIVYNGVLAFFTLFFTVIAYSNRLLDLQYWLSIVVCAVIANMCFCFGPLTEGYGRFLGVWQPSFTKALFIAGLILASLLATLFVVTY